MERADVLRLAGSHPTVAFPDGGTVIADGDPNATLYVLSSGALVVEAGGRAIARLTEPGDIVGEIGLLLGTPAGADVRAVGDTVVHRIVGAASLFEAHPGFGHHLAVVLARRLRHVTSFLGDIDRQFADRRDTLGLVPQVLTGLLGGAVGDVDAGSDREPDSPY